LFQRHAPDISANYMPTNPAVFDAELRIESSGAMKHLKRENSKAAESAMVPSTSPPRLRVILNESAGTAERQDTAGLHDRLQASFDSHGIAASLDSLSGTAIREAAQDALQAARRGALDGFVIGGGDGTIRTAAAVLAGSDVPLGILPLGTRNHFARDLAIPLAPEGAVAVIAAGATRQVDVAEVNGRVFINNSSIGLYPYLVLARQRQRRGSSLPKWLATALATPQIIRNLPLFRLTLHVEGQAEPCRSPIVFIGNNAYQLTFPTVGRRESLDRGELWIYVAAATGWPSLVWGAARAMLGLGIKGRHLCTCQGKTADLTSRRHHVMVACDGEVETMEMPLRYRSRPGALRVFAPPAS
jgi:diacylglycerol kinase family enzyme